MQFLPTPALGNVSSDTRVKMMLESVG